MEKGNLTAHGMLWSKWGIMSRIASAHVGGSVKNVYAYRCPQCENVLLSTRDEG